MPEYVIRNRRTGLYWCAGVCDRESIEEATRFQNQERGSVRLYDSEEWIKIRS